MSVRDTAESIKIPKGGKTTVLTPIESRKILQDILKERARQNDKWGQQDHSLCEWITVLTEEVGEAAKEAIDFAHGPKEGADARYRSEVVQVAAVAMQMLEAYDRGNWRE